MRFFFALSLIARSLSSSVPLSCQGMCSQINLCIGSYCKNNDACFGLYKRPDGSLCDHQTDSTCPDTNPVKCPITTTTTDPTTTVGLTTTTIIPIVNSSIPSEWLKSCDTLCEFTPGCLTQAKGSYCKAWNLPPTCFALFWTSATRDTVCTPVPGAFCPDTYPVLCSEVGEVIPSTV